MIAPDLFEFAYVPDWYGHLAELERLALPESWKFRKPSRETKNADTPILERYIHTIFRKQVLSQENRAGKNTGSAGHTVAHTHRGRESRGRTHPHTTATAPRSHTTGRAGKAQGTPQDKGTAPHRSTAHRRKNKRVHKSTSRCAIVVAWSTRGQTTRSHPTTPLAPLREDMAQGIRACAVSSFACRRGTASP